MDQTTLADPARSRYVTEKQTTAAIRAARCCSAQRPVAYRHLTTVAKDAPPVAFDTARAEERCGWRAEPRWRSSSRHPHAARRWWGSCTG